MNDEQIKRGERILVVRDGVMFKRGDILVAESSINSLNLISVRLPSGIGWYGSAIYFEPVSQEKP